MEREPLLHNQILEKIEKFKKKSSLYVELYKQKRYKEIAYRLKRHRYGVFILLAVVAVFLPWL